MSDQDKAIGDRLAKEAMGWTLRERPCYQNSEAIFDCWETDGRGHGCSEANWKPLKNIEQATRCRNVILDKHPDWCFRLRARRRAGRSIIIAAFCESAEQFEPIIKNEYGANAIADTDAYAICEAVIAVLNTEKDDKK